MKYLALLLLLGCSSTTQVEEERLFCHYGQIKTCGYKGVICILKVKVEGGVCKEE